MLPRFELLTPGTLPEALEMLAGYAPNVLPLAGGTNLVPDMREGKQTPKTVVDISGLEELKGIREEDGHVVIGSGVTIAKLLESDLVAQQGGLLREAASHFANPLVRNRATVGGNLGNASPAADTAPPLLALGAEVALASSERSRWVPLEEFFLYVCDTVCERTELIRAIRWPTPAPRSFGGFRKFMLRKTTAISVVSVAAQLIVDFDGWCEDVRISLGAVAPTPIRARDAEEVIRGETLTAEVIDTAASFACRAASCITDIRGSSSYRERVTEVLMRRLLNTVLEEVA